MKEKFCVSGMTCSACSAGIERTLLKIEGVKSAEVSLMGESMVVEYDESVLSQKEIIDAVVALGYGAEIFNREALKSREPAGDTLKKRFLFSLIFLIPLMYFSMGGMISLPQPSAVVSYTIQMVLTLLIIVINFKFFTSGTKALIKLVPNMDTLVAMGAAVSFVYSFVLTVLTYIHGGTHGHLFYESAAMILTLVTLGKWLEEKSKRKTGDEIEKLIKLMPNTVTIEQNGMQREIAFSEISVGDILIVKQGDYIPVDGKIVEGHAFVDRAAITGESLPIEVMEGNDVTGADILKSGYLKVLAQKVGSDTTLSQIIKMVKDAGASKAPIQKLADKIAGIFVPAVTFIALVVFIIWLSTSGELSTAANYAISVLVISCPCSLGLATPVAVMAATGRGMALGVLYKDAEALQKAKDINCVLLDKTATLTVGQPKVTDFEIINGKREELLRIAAAIEANSNHPIAECVKEFALGLINENTLTVENYAYEMGKGATAMVNGTAYILGNRKLLSEKVYKTVKEKEKSYSKDGKTVVFLSNSQGVLAIFAIADTLKETSKEAVESLKARGVRTAMLTGDNENVACAIAQKVGIDEYFAEALPEDKVKAVQRVQAVGGYVAMVGDGINDSPALKTADIGVAMGTGTDIAIDSADVVLVGGDLRAVSKMIDLSKAAVTNIKQNLFWAFFYNCVAIPVAAGVFAFAGITLNPMIASACMSLSSLFVVTNALRLTKFGKKDEAEETPVQELPTLENHNTKETTDMKKTMYIEGMMCKHCVAHVTKALSAVEGVESVEVSLDNHCAYITLNAPTSNESLSATVVEAGYEVVKIEN